MGWRDTQAKVESGALNFRRSARSNSDYFFDAATSSFSDAFRTRKAEEAEADRYKRNRKDQLEDYDRTLADQIAKEKRDIARENEKIRLKKVEDGLKNTAAEEKIVSKRRKLATKLLTENNMDTTNPNFMSFAMDHLSAYGDSFDDAKTNFAELSKRMTIVGPAQGPTVTGETLDVTVDDQMKDLEDATADRIAFDAKPVSDGVVISKYLENLNSVNEIIGRQTMVRTDATLTTDEKATIQAELNQTMNEMINQKEKAAEREQGPLMYMPINDQGMAIPGRSVIGRRVKDGIKTEDGSIVKGSYRYVNEGFIKDFVKFNNDTIEDLSDYQASAANLTRDLIDLKGIVLQNPAVTNRFAVAATDIASFLREGASTFTAFLDEGKSYSYEEALTSLEKADLVPERKIAETLKLRIAYGLARLEGSSGMSLSDKELSAQLDSVLASGDPKKALSLIDAQIRGLTKRSETTRSTKVDNFLGVGADVKNMYPNAKWNMPMQDYIRGELDENQIVELDRSLDADTVYDLSQIPTSTVDISKGEGLSQLEDWANGKTKIEGIYSLQIYKEVISENPKNAKGMLRAALQDFNNAGIPITIENLAILLEVNIDE
jgi:hypothetical protein